MIRNILGVPPYQVKTSKLKIGYPISLTEAKRHLRVEDSFVQDDDMIQDIIEDATEIIESFIQKDIALTQNVTEIYDFIGDTVWIEESPLKEVTEIISDASTAVTWENTFPYYNYFQVDLTSGSSITSDPLTVKYTTGYSFSDSDIPKTLKRAILIKIGDLYDVERQGYSLTTIKSNDAVDRLIAKYKSTIF